MQWSNRTKPPDSRAASALQDLIKKPKLVWEGKQSNLHELSASTAKAGYYQRNKCLDSDTSLAPLALIKASFRRLSYARCQLKGKIPCLDSFPSISKPWVGCLVQPCSTGKGEGFLWNAWRNNKGCVPCCQDKPSLMRLALKLNIFRNSFQIWAPTLVKDLL